MEPFNYVRIDESGPAVAKPPQSASRFADGSGIDFSFFGPNLTGTQTHLITAGASSAVMVIRTNATQTVVGTAAAQVPDLDGELRVDDLRAAGWTVHGPRKVRGGGVRVVARRPFGTPAEAARAVAQLTGPSGPFPAWRIRSRSRQAPRRA